VEYEIDAYEITITPPLSSTMMLCSSTIMDQEHEYFDLLRDAETFQVDNDQLIISCSGNKELVFVEQ
jgi:heat shock protein HslJ